jgi:hypothetical protein
MKTRIHVNQHNIRANLKGADLPVLTVKTYKENVKCNRVAVHGPSTVVYSPDKPLSCGAKVWIETESEVTVDEEPPAAKDLEERPAPLRSLRQSQGKCKWKRKTVTLLGLSNGVATYQRPVEYTKKGG